MDNLNPVKTYLINTYGISETKAEAYMRMSILTSKKVQNAIKKDLDNFMAKCADYKR